MCVNENFLISLYESVSTAENYPFFSIEDLMCSKDSLPELTLPFILNQKELISFPDLNISTLQEIADILKT